MSENSESHVETSATSRSPEAARERTPARDLVASAFARHDVAALVRLRDYQASIERASALLFRVQPDLIAGETVAIKEHEPARSGWPLILAIGASGLAWLAIAWAILAVV